MSNNANIVKIADHSVYGNLVSGIMYIIFTLVFFNRLIYRKSDKNDMDITYEITYFILAAMFLVFMVEHIFKYNFDGSSDTLKKLIIFGCLFLVHLNTGLSWIKTYYEDKSSSDDNTAKNIQYTNGVLTLLIGVLFIVPALLNLFISQTNLIQEIPLTIFGIGYIILGCIKLHFYANPNANRYLYMIPFIVLSISLVTFIIKIAINYNNRFSGLRDCVMALICGQILTVLLKDVLSKDNERKPIHWIHFTLLFMLSIVHISIFILNPDRPK
jgi:hypothetical protein